MLSRAARGRIVVPLPRNTTSLHPAARHVSSSATATPPNNTLRNVFSATVLVASGTVLAFYYLDSRSALHRYGFMPLIRATMDPETGHKFAVKVLASGLAPRDLVEDDEKLGVELWGHRLSSPVGLAAGFDKDGDAIQGLFNLGFSWVEIGSVTPKPQGGNPKPRFFHLSSDSAIINRYGFPSKGHPILLSQLRSYLASHPPSANSSQILALNLGKNKSSAPDSIDDFISGVHKFGPLVDVLVINVSSPNTPGLRGMQGRAMLEELLSEVVKARDELASRRKEEWKWDKAKVVVKIAPDLDVNELEDVAEAVKTSGVDGVIVSNTTIQRPDSLTSIHALETGGLSGPPLQPLSLQALLTLRGLLPASIPLIGCGGISSGEDALKFAASGATLVQVYTSFGYGGVGTPRRIKDEILEGLGTANSWNDVTHVAINKLSLKPPPSGEDLLKKQAEELDAVLDTAGQQIALGDEVMLLGSEIVPSAVELDLPPADVPADGQIPTVIDSPATTAIIEDVKTSLPKLDLKAAEEATFKAVQELIEEAERALGVNTESGELAAPQELPK